MGTSVSSTIKLVIVDDEECHLERLKMVFYEDGAFSVAGAFLSPAKALEQLKSLAPDILITDIYMPEMSGLTLIELVHGLLPDLPICALSVRDDREIIRKAILAGASGYLLKTETPGGLRGRLREVISDGAAFSPAAAVKVVAHLRLAKQEGEDSLSFRELEILQSLTGGDTYKETAERFGLSVHTVHNHMKNIFEKLGVNRKRDAIRAARASGLI